MVSCQEKREQLMKIRTKNLNTYKICQDQQEYYPLPADVFMWLVKMRKAVIK